MMERTKLIRLKWILRMGFCLALVAAMVLIGAVMASAEVYSGECGAQGNNVTWIVDTETGELDIFGTGHMKSYDSYDKAPWYQYRDNIKEITIHDGITLVNSYAFDDCVNLKTINLSKTITSFNVLAVRNCTGLENIHVDKDNIYYRDENNCLINGNVLVWGCEKSIIPDDGSVEIIGGRAFYSSKEDLTHILLPDSIVEIDDYAFSGCYKLESIKMSENLAYIGDQAFSMCRSLKEITIPSSVKAIGWRSFEMCDFLDKVHISDIGAWCQITYSERSSNPLSKAEKLYVNGELIQELIIPDCVTEIKAHAFYCCTNIKTVKMGVNVVSIGQGAFYWCENLTNIILTNQLTMVGEGAFSTCYKLDDIYFYGTQTEWNSITIETSNTALLNATIHFLGEPTAPTESKLTSASVTLGDSLSLNYYATLTPAHTAAQMRFTYHGETTLVSGVLDEASGEYKFTFGRIPPQCMGDNVKAELILISEDGTETVLDVKESYSIREYCDDALAANPNNEALTTLLADLLAYGDAAQDYANYNEDTPVSEGFEVAPSEWEDVTDTDFTLSDKTREELCFTAAGVRFGYVNRVYFKIKAADLTGVTLTVNGKTYTADDLTLAEDTADTYIFYTDAVYATEFDKVFTAELSVDGEVIQVVTYSVKSYVCAKQKSNDTEIAALVKALYNYGRSAIAYKNTL